MAQAKRAVPVVVQQIRRSILIVRGQHIKFRPYVFTEHGAIQAANVLNSPRAIAMGVYVAAASDYFGVFALRSDCY